MWAQIGQRHGNLKWAACVGRAGKRIARRHAGDASVFRAGDNPQVLDVCDVRERGADGVRAIRMLQKSAPPPLLRATLQCLACVG